MLIQQQFSPETVSILAGQCLAKMRSETRVFENEAEAASKQLELFARSQPVVEVIKPTQKPKAKRKAGRQTLLSVEQLEDLRVSINDLVPADILGDAGEKFWTAKAVQCVIAKLYRIPVAISTARNYMHRLDFSSPLPLPRQNRVKASTKQWIETELPRQRMLGEKKRPIIWLFCRANSQRDMLREDFVQLHAVSNVGKRGFIALTEADRAGQISSFLSTFSANKDVLYVFDESVIKGLGDLAIKETGKELNIKKHGQKDAARRTPLKVRRFLKKVSGAEVIPVEYKVNETPKKWFSDDTAPGGAENHKDLSEAQLDRLGLGMVAWNLENTINGCFANKKCEFGEPTRDDHVAWLTSDSEEVCSYIWTMRFFGLVSRESIDSFRMQVLLAGAVKAKNPKIREELIELASYYQ